MDFGGLFFGDGGDMAGLTGHSGGMFINTLVIMWRFAVAIGAVDLIFPVQVSRTDRGCASFNLVGFSLVAGDALEVVLAHMYINAGRREVQAFIQIAVFYGIAAATLKMTAAAICSRGASHALCHRRQVNAIGRIAASAFLVGAGAIVAYQAVNIFLV